MLELRQVTRRVSGQLHLSEISLQLQPGTLNVLLGPTLSGKTSLLRVMAGLERPSSGQILVNGKDVTGLPVQQRRVAMVYQQFINYPGWTVRQNIQSPLRVQRRSHADLEVETKKVAQLLQLEHLLDRKPLELSGGQQQRVALARALVKKADLVLLDEPLANLDYKLREDLRAQLPQLFQSTNTIVLYATTEPIEALALGGMTATLAEGRLTQFGPTLDVYRKPRDLITAKSFSDPPLNTVAVVDAKWVRAPLGSAILGFRPHHLKPGAGTGAALTFGVQVISTEITGSESFVHVACGSDHWVMLAHGIQVHPPGAQLQVHVEPAHVMAFDSSGRSLDPSLREAA